MSVSKKDFEAIALILKRLGDGYGEANDGYFDGTGELMEKDDLVFELVRYFKSENPNFDASKFAIACGYPAGREGWIND